MINVCAYLSMWAYIVYVLVYEWSDGRMYVRTYRHIYTKYAHVGGGCKETSGRPTCPMVKYMNATHGSVALQYSVAKL